ncbi:multiple epidermal growth factor-like domains protein 10 [Haliotis rufescens]|uniref:multiple epidermal growth factor-like domains protein 10 n=1 Tax=Haliotis rufescens TaxID=6454 RepID=UPI00201EDA09|nr:multiple epidermal growth factor-like domains protein 10 [Haliotis rufescens]
MEMNRTVDDALPHQNGSTAGGFITWSCTSSAVMAVTTAMADDRVITGFRPMSKLLALETSEWIGDIHLHSDVEITSFNRFRKGRQCKTTPCKDGQHCAVCDETGDCSSTCHPGYFNKRCTSTCNSGCRHKACKLLKGSGIAACIHGCNPGLQGTSCNIPCEHQRQCTECKGGCYDGYCQIGSACVSRCVDSYYGLDCKNCSDQCQSCNRSTGMCEQCHSPYTGPNCEMPCENCKGTCKAGCEGGCNPGFYGHWCDKVCSENCRAGLDATFVLECDRNVSNTCIIDCDKKTGHCIHGCNPGFYGQRCEKVCSENCLPDPNGTLSSACDRNVSNNCTPECDKTTGYCIRGCNLGWHGTNCSSRCNSKCANLSCTESGACLDGCAPGYAGTDCSCYENCIKHICHSENGTCVKGTNQADQYLEAYQPASMYWEIADEDVNLGGQPLDTEASDAQLREVQDREADVASDGTSEDSLSYSHLVRTSVLMARKLYIINTCHQQRKSQPRPRAEHPP